MIRNRNGFWMSPKFYAMFSADNGGGSGGDGGAGGDGAPAGDGNGDGAGNGDGDGGNGQDDLKSQIEKLQADLAKQKAALDKATHEASDYKKALNESKNALKAKMTQEEIDAAAKKEAEEKQALELEELRRKVSKAENTKSVMGKLSVDEETAGQIAESLTGCENIENALLLIQKAWTAKEKALRLEFGKIPGPGTGGGSEDKEAQAAIELAKELGQRKARNTESVRTQLGGLVR